MSKKIKFTSGKEMKNIFMLAPLTKCKAMMTGHSAMTSIIGLQNGQREGSV